MTKTQVEVITSVERRRRWSRAEKERIVAAAMEPGAVASAVAREAGIPYGQKIHLRRPARSRRFAMVITQEPTQSLAALHGPLATNVRIPREQQDIALPLVVSLSVEMLDILAERPSQRALTDENHLGQALLLH